MATTAKALNDKLRETYLKEIINTFMENGEEVLRVGANEIAMPCVDEEGNEKYIVITVKVPTGARKYGKEEYNGHEEAQDYAFKCKEKTEKAERIAKEKEEKRKRKEKEEEIEDK